MGLLKAELNDIEGAEKYLKAALKVDPQMAQAAYNLCIIASTDRLGEAVTYCKIAADLRPQEPRYAYTLAFLLMSPNAFRLRPAYESVDRRFESCWAHHSVPPNRMPCTTGISA
jgi:tetratricopeptide (TPR) repeat protein